MFRGLKPDDLALLYFSGHGIKDQAGRLYLATTDTEHDYPDASAVEGRFIQDTMLNSRSHSQVLILDCCYGGAFAKGMTHRGGERIGTAEVFQGRGQVVLAASDAVQFAFEGDQVAGEGIRSVFTSTLVDGLRTGEADLDGDGYISVDNLFDYVSIHVPRRMPQQTPIMSAIGVRGDLIIAQNPHQRLKPAELPIEVLEAIESPDALSRLGAVEELGRLLGVVNPRMVLAASEALRKLADDFDRRVFTQATELLERHHQQTLAQRWDDGRRAYETGSWAEAIRLLEALVAEDPNYEDAARVLEVARRQQELTGLYADAHRLHESKQWQAVVEVFQQIQALDPEYRDPDGLQESAAKNLEEKRELDALHRDAGRLIEAQDWEQAGKQLMELQRRSPNYPDVELLLARVQQGQERAAREQQLISLYDHAQSAYETKHWEQAIEALHKIVALEPNYQDAGQLLAEATRQQQELAQHWADGRRAFEAGSWEEAIRHLEAVVAVDASYEDAARVLEDARRQQELAGLYAEARRRHEAGEWQAVVEVFVQIQALNPEHPDPDRLWTSARQHLEQERELDALHQQAVRHVKAQGFVQDDEHLKELQPRRPGYGDAQELQARVGEELAIREERTKIDTRVVWASRIEYVDFDLEISSGAWPSYSVVARWERRVAKATMEFPDTPLAFENKRLKVENVVLNAMGQRRRVNTPDQQVVQEFGRTLFDALLTGSVRSSYEVCLQAARQQGKGVRLRLCLQPPELAALPWEFLYNSEGDEFVSLKPRTPLVRFVDVPVTGESLQVTPPLRVLGMVANPAGNEVLNVEHEQDRVEQATASLQQRGLLELTWLNGQTWHALQRALRRGPWHVFHFIGHGGFDPALQEGLIELADDAGRVSPISAADMSTLLDGHYPLRLVLLNSCEGAYGSSADIFSSTAATLIRRGIPAVLAMQYAISDTGAIRFVRAFYEAIADGLPVDVAVCEARVALRLEMRNSFEWAVPVLYLRSTDAHIFAVESSSQMLQLTSTPEQPPEDREVSGTQDDGPEIDSSEQDGAEHERLQELLVSLYTEARAAYDALQWEQAMETLSEIVALQPGFLDAEQLLREASLRQQALAQHWTEGRRAYEDNLWKEAVQHFIAILAEDADNDEAARLLEEARRQQALAGLYAEARRLHEENQWQAVVEVFERILELNPEYPDPEGLWAAARQYLEQQQLTRLYNEARAAYDEKRWATAAETLREIIRVQPDYQDTGRLLADATRQQYKLDRLEVQHIFGRFGRLVNSVTFSPDGQLLACASGGTHFDVGGVWIWRVVGGKFLRSLEGLAGSVRSVAFSPDGQILASASIDQMVRLWGVVDGKLLRTLEGHAGKVRSVAFSPDGQVLASGSTDRTVGLWEVADGTFLRRLAEHTRSVNSVAFSPDGQILASASDDKTVRLWGVPKE
jgi:hypothetical protein